MKYRILKKLLFSSFVLLVSVIAASLIHAPKAASDNGYGCGVTTGSVHSMAGLIVNVTWVPYGTSTQEDDNNSDVVVSTLFPSSTPSGNVARMSSSGSEEGTYGTVSFKQVNANCAGAGYVGDLGYGQTSPNDVSSGSTNYWALDCDMSIHPDHPQAFTVTGSGTPAGARAGGTWSSQPVAPPNGATQYTTVTYYEPAPASSWTLTASSTVSRTTASPGDRVGFTHRITNNGPSTADSQYTVHQSPNLPPYSIPPNESPNSGSVSAPKGGTMLAMEEDITIPANAANGTQYCEWLTYNHGTGPSAGNANTAQACVTVSVSSVGGTDCPGNATVNGFPLVNVALPDQSPYGNGPNQPSGTTSSYNAPYTQDVSEKKTVVTAVNDTSSGGSRVGISLSGDRLNSPTTTPGHTKLDYTPFVNTYPYDPSSTSVTYDSYYDETTYHATIWDHNSCTGVDTVSGDTCINKYAASSAVSCPGGWSYYNAGALGSGTPAGCWQRQGVGGSCSFTAAQLAPYGGVGWCYGGASNPSANPTTTYSCDRNDGSPDSSHNCTHTYTATKNYRWKQDGPTSTGLTKSGTVAGYAMNACYNRGFQVNSVGTGQPQYTPSTENPTGVTGGPGSVSVSYTVPASKLRQPNQVTLRYTASYTIDKAGGAVVPYGNCSGTNGSVTADSSGSGSMGTSNCSVSLPTVQLGDQMCVQYSVTPTGDYMDVGGTPQSSDNPAYNNSSGYGNGQTMSSSVVCSSAIDNQPYARFYGNDVLAGSQFGSSGSCDSSAAITTYGSGTGPRATGSGSQFAAMSLGTISQFASAFLRGATVPTSAKGLSFANTGSGVDTTYGGKFGSACAQAPDYYGAAPAATPAGGSLDIGGGNNPGATSLKVGGGGSLTINASSPVSGSKVVYVNGNVYIPNNITYAAGGNLDSTTGRVSGVTSLYIVVKGNIYIAPGVTQLDGIYVAEGSGGSGIINTCAQSNGAFDPSALVDNCSGNQLSVTGAFVANTVKFDRTFASVRNSIGGEESIDGATTHDCGFGNNGYTNGSHPDCAAETFDFTPLNYLGSPAIPASGGANTNTYDYITSLSPVL